MQADGGQLSGKQKQLLSCSGSLRHTLRLKQVLLLRLAEWKPMYQPTPEQAEKDRRAAYESGVPHGQCSVLVITLSSNTLIE